VDFLVVRKAGGKTSGTPVTVAWIRPVRLVYPRMS
jgi:hypothetical protein